MSDDPTVTKPRGGLFTWALWGAALLGVAAVVYIILQATGKPAVEVATEVPAAQRKVEGVSAKWTKAEAPQPLDYAFYDAAGKPVRIADLKGKVVVLNIWATWCAPCVAEMPTLAKLQAAYKDKPVEVAAVSIDSVESGTKAKLFIAKHDPLEFYHDREGKLPFQLKPPAMGAPTTVVFGPDGLERGRVSGEADWSAPDAKALIDQVLAGG